MTRQISNEAQVAKNIRQGLKKKGLTARVKVRAHNWIVVELTDASPSQYDDAHAFCKTHQFGHFCGMTDIYVNSNSIDGMQQVEYVSMDVDFTPDLRQEALDALAAKYELEAMSIDNLPRTITLLGDIENTQSMLRQVLRGKDYPLVRFWETKQALATAS